MSHVHVCSSSRRRWHAALHGDSGSHRGDKRSGIPPHAGKTYLCSIELALRWDHPRVCGENITQVKRGATIAGSPPRVRGKPMWYLHPERVRGITPACAGKTDHDPTRVKAERDHPRVCGENLFPLATSQIQPGSPPRVRGKLDEFKAKRLALGITPACAGKTPRACGEYVRSRDHPRVCGENMGWDDEQPLPQGSPPRVRGKPSQVS